jgi:hypothetical protein
VSDFALTRSLTARSLAVLTMALLLTACSSGSPNPSAAGEEDQSSPNPTTSGTPESSVRYADYCDGEPGCAPGGIPQSLRRPLKIPVLKPGAGCPTSPSRVVSPAFARGLGDGPAYPLLPRRGVLPIQYPPFSAGHQFAGSKWGGEKVLWVSDPAYTGPILIRGHQIDGPNPVRFDRDPAKLLPELQFPPEYAANYSGGWRNFPSHTRLRALGCYAYQVDGADFSDIIVFKVIIARS